MHDTIGAVRDAFRELSETIHALGNGLISRKVLRIDRFLDTAPLGSIGHRHAGTERRKTCCKLGVSNNSAHAVFYTVER